MRLSSSRDKSYSRFNNRSENGSLIFAKSSTKANIQRVLKAKWTVLVTSFVNDFQMHSTVHFTGTNYMSFWYLNKYSNLFKELFLVSISNLWLFYRWFNFGSFQNTKKPAHDLWLFVKAVQLLQLVNLVWICMIEICENDLLIFAKSSKNANTKRRLKSKMNSFCTVQFILQAPIIWFFAIRIHTGIFQGIIPGKYFKHLASIPLDCFGGFQNTKKPAHDFWLL